MVRRHAARLRGLSPLDRKLARDLWSAKGQVVAIALVVAAGIALFVSLFSTFDSLDLSLRTYYDRYRFADVFLSLTRAPLSLQAEIEAIPGVAQVETRVVMDVTIDVAGLAEPATGRLISIPAGRPPALCDVFLRAGRTIEAGHPGRGARQRVVREVPRPASGRRRRRYHQRPPPRACGLSALRCRPSTSTRSGPAN